ncbi:alpha/beta fold hydrolase [Halocatena salina]|uniref:Alpha/beta hydrolase n=1 Tax=Halocatena salina TaxID=2934340 RepID=A0A8U0A582_9EURY|nr:alpha/beta hydrolase [Halocatena salina]UPM43628.1 alpha/beta hydrolase [Halocatena salina]
MGSSAVETLVLPDGRRLAYATYGDEDGAPLVFHHGIPGTCFLGSLFENAAREQGSWVIAPTRPGYGESDPHDTTLETWATDCEVLADHLSLDSFAVAGFSGGGPFALAVAEQSDRVSAVGLVGALVPENDGGLLETLSRVSPALEATLCVVRWVARVRGPEFVLGQFTGETVDSSTASAVSQDFRRALAGRPTGAVRESRLFANEWSLPAPDVPVRAWHGVADENVRIDPVRAVAADRSTVTLSEIDTDHLGALLTVREALLDLAVTGVANE